MQLLAETEPRTASETPPICDNADCSELSAFTYTWDWGASGVCCAKHQMLLQQSSEHLARRVNFGALNLAPPPLTRDERARLKGEVYAVEAEIADVRARGVELYKENTALVRQVQTVTVRMRELDAQLNDARGDVANLQRKLEERDAEHGQMVDELTRLRTLAKFTQTDAPLLEPEAYAARPVRLQQEPVSSFAAMPTVESRKPGTVGFPLQQQPVSLPTADGVLAVDLPVTLVAATDEQAKLDLELERLNREERLLRDETTVVDGPAIPTTVPTTTRRERHHPKG